MAYGFIFQNNDRPDIVFEDGTIRGGLHCGDCIELYIGKWTAARIEYDDGWLVVIHGEKQPIPYGSRCKE